MTDREFIYWLKGIIDTSPDGTLSGKQLGVVKRTMEEVISNKPHTGPIHRPNSVPNPIFPNITC